MFWYFRFFLQMPRTFFYECVHRFYKNFATRILVVGTCQACQALTGHSVPGCDSLFYNDIPDLQRYNGDVRPSRFWTPFLTNISFQSGYSSTASDLISIFTPSLTDGCSEKRVSAKDCTVLWCHYHARTRYMQKRAGAQTFAGSYRYFLLLCGTYDLVNEIISVSESEWTTVQLTILKKWRR